MLSKEQLQHLYQHYPVLLKIEPDLLAETLANATLLEMEAGTFIFDELQRCQAFPFILAGDLRVFKQSASGRELSLYNVKAGDACVVTAGCLLGNKPYNATGRAQTQSKVVLLPAEDFENLLAIRVFREYIFDLFSKRVLELMQLVEQVAFQKLDQRLAALLLNRGKRISASHQLLADELGSVREMISRLLKGFADSGLVSLGREQIDILDETGLKRIAGSD